MNDLALLDEFAERTAGPDGKPLVRVEKLDDAAKVTGWLGGLTRANSFDDKRYTSVGQTSAKSLDRYGTIIEPEGMDFKNYRKNPVVLLNHWDFGPMGIPIGKCLWDKVTDSGVDSMTQFPVEEMLELKSSRIPEIWGLHRSGCFGALSVSLIAHEWEEFKNGDSGRGVRFTKTEKLEHSLVSLPGNADAVTYNLSRAVLASAKRFGLKTPTTELPGRLGVMSRAARMVRESDDLSHEILAGRFGDRHGLKAAQRMLDDHLRLSPRLKSTSDTPVSVADALALLRDAGEALRTVA
jgi:hypothetical protein